MKVFECVLDLALAGAIFEMWLGLGSSPKDFFSAIMTGMRLCRLLGYYDAPSLCCPHEDAPDDGLHITCLVFIPLLIHINQGRHVGAGSTG